MSKPIEMTKEHQIIVDALYDKSSIINLHGNHHQVIFISDFPEIADNILNKLAEIAQKGIDEMENNEPIEIICNCNHSDTHKNCTDCFHVELCNIHDSSVCATFMDKNND